MSKKYGKWAVCLWGVVGILATVSMVSAQVAVITTVKGKVEVQRAGESDWKPVVTKTDLNVNDKVQTKKGANCEITLDDGSIIKLRENTTLEINDLSEDKDTKKKSSVFKLLLGKLWAKAEYQEDSKFEVVTPTSIAGIRGTEFAIIVAIDGASDILVFKGKIEVRSLIEEDKEIRTVLVEAGKALGIKPGEIGLPRDLSPLEKEDWQKFLEGKRVLLINPATDEERESLKQDISRARENFIENRKFAYAVKEADLSAGKTLFDHEKRLVRVQQYLMRPAPNLLRFLNLNFRPGYGEQWAFHYWQNDWKFTSALPKTLVGTIVVFAGADPRNPLIKAESIFANNAPGQSNRDEFVYGWDKYDYPSTDGMYARVNGQNADFDPNYEGPQLIEGMTNDNFYAKTRIYFDNGGTKGTVDMDQYIINNLGKTLGVGDFVGADASKLFEFRNNINLEMVFDLNGMKDIVAMKNGGIIDVVVIPEIIYSGIERVLSELDEMLKQFQSDRGSRPFM